MLLQLGDLDRDGGLGEMQFLRGAGKAQVAGDRLEDLELAESGVAQASPSDKQSLMIWIKYFNC
jgi:hypothetical protein